MKHFAFATSLALLFSFSTSAFSQQAGGDRYVSKEEYEKLRHELDGLKVQMQAVLSQRGGVPQPATASGVQDPEKENLKKDLATLTGEVQELKSQAESRQAEMDDTIDEFEQRIKAAKDQAQAASPGTTNFLVTGYAFANFTDREGENSSFKAQMEPIFLWRLSDRIFFEGEAEFALEDSEEVFGLEYAQITYLLNDCVTIGAGKFLTPFGIFPERLHPAWINKLPDFPLALREDGGLVPFSQVGVQARGVIPLCDRKLNYALYLSNGPRLNTGEDEPGLAGSLDAHNFDDINNNKAFGFRLGYQMSPALEVGYSFLTARVGESGTELAKVDAQLYGVDLSYVREVACLCGNIDFRTEFIWSDVDNAAYDLGGPAPVTFDNKRDGAYMQLAYRPTKAECDCIKNLESIVRFDYLNRHNAPDPIEHFSEQRWTLGLNYWLGPSTVVKVAYELDNRDSGEKDQDAFLAQFAIGF
jgi:hypothetical protein